MEKEEGLRALTEAEASRKLGSLQRQKRRPLGGEGQDGPICPGPKDMMRGAKGWGAAL